MASSLIDNLGFARVDHDRVRRRGHPEAVYCPGKSCDQVLAIAHSFMERGVVNVLVTRASADVLAALKDTFASVEIHRDANLAILNPALRPGLGLVAVVGWRGADRPVAAEASWTARALGSAVLEDLDAPVEDPQQLPRWAAGLADANAIVAVDGTGTGVWSLVAGLCAAPVIALPTSSGDDLAGLPALLSAVNSCVPGVLTVNVDNGFGAGYAAHLINERTAPTRRQP